MSVDNNSDKLNANPDEIAILEGVVDRVRDILGEKGRASGFIRDFRPRAPQLKMAELIAKIMEDPGGSQDLVIEAETGIGKTLAYALPALISGRKVLFSTTSRYLQDQLFGRNLPVICEMIDEPFNAALLKGRASYVCLERMKKTEFVTTSEKRKLDRLRRWSEKTQHGDLDKYDGEALDSDTLIQITSTAENCGGRRCPEYGDCFVYRARREALEAQVVVTNHTLLLHDLRMREQGWSELLPRVDVCIFDEAHKLLETASDVYSTEISLQKLSHKLDNLAEKASELEESVVAECARQLISRLFKLNQALTRHATQLGRAGSIPPGAQRFELTSADSAEAPVPGPSVGQKMVGRTSLTEPDSSYEDFALEGVCAQTEHRQLFDDIIAGLDELALQLETSELAEEHGYLKVSAVARIKDQFTEIIGAANEDHLGAISYFRLYPKSTQLCMIPFDFSEKYSRQIRELCARGIYTSATLCVNKNFDYFTEQLGLYDANTDFCGSDFNYADQSLLWLPGSKSAQSPTYAGRIESDRGGYRQKRQANIDRFITSIAPVLRQLQGRSMILMTSRQALESASVQLRRTLPEMNLLVQGEQASPVLVNRFLSEQPAVLIGLYTFWEGLDIRGSQLVFVAIDKLPFDYPHTPVNIKRQKFMESRRQNFFQRYLLPKAVLQLKQGAGRLIRDYHDFGILKIADSRLLQRSYGKLFLASLPAFARTVDIDDVLRFARTYCRTDSEKRRQSPENQVDWDDLEYEYDADEFLDEVE